MNEGRKFRWLHMALLLGAFAAGGITTRLIPAYEPFVGKITYPTQSASASDAPSNNAGGFSAANANGHRMTFAREMN